MYMYMYCIYRLSCTAYLTIYREVVVGIERKGEKKEGRK